MESCYRWMVDGHHHTAIAALIKIKIERYSADTRFVTSRRTLAERRLN